MSASATSGSAVNSHILDQCRTTLKACEPNISEEECKKTAETLGNIVQFFTDSAPDLATFKQNNQRFKQKLMQVLPQEFQTEFQTTHLALKQKQKKILQAKNLKEQDDGHSVEQELTQALAESVMESKEMQKQTCLTCKKKNGLYETESNEILPILKRCGKCKTAMYCSVTCQGKDWSRHKLECISKK